MVKGPFNIRVYGILINVVGEVLLSKEHYKEITMIKFPGGGLEPGEGLRDGLAREWQEELQIDIEVGAHFYTTDFYQPSAFDNTQQVISVYYHVVLKEPEDAGRLATAGHARKGEPEFFWEKLNTLQPIDVTMPIDKHVVSLLIKK